MPGWCGPEVAEPFKRGNMEEEPVALNMSHIEACLPAKLHSFSRQVLEIYLLGHMSTAEFRRWFHMPNSDYLMLGDCIAQKVDPYYVPEAQLPPSITLKPNTL
jgi:hypothetical protein